MRHFIISMLLVLPFISMAGTSVDAAIRDTGMTAAPAPVSASASPKTRSISKSRLKTILSACKKYEGADALFMGSVSTFLLKKLLKLTSPADPDMEKAFAMMEEVERLTSKLPGLNCGSCGSPSCRALAEDIVRGYSTENACVFVLRDEVQHIADLLSKISGIGMGRKPIDDKKNDDRSK
jgi:hypothetical protein